MPVSPALAENLAQGVVDMYADAERVLLERVARNIARGIDTPDWAERKLLEVRVLERQTQRLVSQLGDRAAARVAVDLAKAYNRGGAAAANDLAALLKISLEEAAAPLVGLPAVELLVADTMGYLTATHPRILRATMDAYRSIISETAAQVLIGSQTRRQAAQSALDRFAAKGITGFVDKAGRGWNLTSYVEMAMRTATGKAAVAGHIDRLAAFGIDLVIGSDAPHECPLCSPWEGRVMSISGKTPGYPTLADAHAAGWQHPNCFPAGVAVSGPDILLAESRWYEGEMLVISTASRQELPVTPNHPILTPHGWVAADSLREGDDVICYLGQERMRKAVDPHEVEMPAMIEEIPAALLKSGEMSSACVPVAPADFHGDGTGGEVEIVYPDCLLRGGGKTTIGQPLTECALGAVDFADALDGQSALGPFFNARDSATGRRVGSGGLASTLSRSHPFPLASFGSAAVGTVSASEQGRTYSGLRASDLGCNLALGNAIQMKAHGGGDPIRLPSAGTARVSDGPENPERPQAFVQRRTADSDGRRNRADTLTGMVSTDHVVEVKRRKFAGHVYNLQTVNGWYSANGIVSHNCRHSVAAYQEGVTKPMHGTEDPEGYADTVKLRYLEREVRASKRMQAVAMDDAALAKATRRLNKYRADIRHHVATTKAKRVRWRESFGVSKKSLSSGR